VLRCAKDMLVAHNTFLNLDYWTYDINTNSTTFSGQIDGLRIINNVVSMAAGKVYGLGAGIPLSTMTIDYNLDYSPNGLVATVSGFGNAITTSQLRSWTGQQAHGVNAAPGFVDTGALDMRLTPGSAAVDSGTVLPTWSTGYRGVAPDMGRHER